MLSFQILVPLLPVYGMRFSSSESLIGFLAGAIALAALLTRPFTGIAADRYNCNRIIVLTQLGTAIVVVLYVIAPNIGILIAMRFLQGIFFGFSSTIIMTSAIRVTPDAKMTQGIGILGAAGLGTQAVAPMIGLWIVGRWDYNVLFVFTGAIALMASMLALTTKIGRSSPRALAGRRKDKPQVATESGSSSSLPATESGSSSSATVTRTGSPGSEEATGSDNLPTQAAEPKAPRFSLKNFLTLEAGALIGILVLFAAASAVPSSYIVVFANARGIPHSGLYYTLFALVIIAVRVFGSGIFNRFPLSGLLIFCAVCSAASLALTGSASSFLPLGIGAALMGMGYGISAPVLLTRIVSFVSVERQGAASATYYMAIDFSYVMAPVAMGFIAEASDYNIGFYCFVATSLALIPLILVNSRKQR